MSSVRRLSVVVAALSTVVSTGLATAATVTYTGTVANPVFTYSLPETSGSSAATVQGFDPSLGLLTGVQVTINQTEQADDYTFTLHNNSSDGYLDWVKTHAVAALVNPLTGHKMATADAEQDAYPGGSAENPVFAGGADKSFPIARQNVTSTNLVNVSSYDRAAFLQNGTLSLSMAHQGLTLEYGPQLSLVSSGGSITTSTDYSVQYTYVAKPTSTPTATTVGLDSTNTVTTTGGLRWLKFDYTGGNLDIDTLGSSLANGNDTVLALYSADGYKYAFADDIDYDNGNYLSAMHFTDDTLLHGTYYLAVYGYAGSMVANQAFGVSGSPYGSGTIVVNFSTPEPASLALLGVGGLLLRRRMRFGAAR